MAAGILILVGFAIMGWSVLGLINPRRFAEGSRARAVGVGVIGVALFMVGGAIVDTEESSTGVTPTGGPVEVAIDFEVEMDSRGQLCISGETNLPNETRMLFSLSKPATDYRAQDSIQVQNGRFETACFSNRGASLAAGVYEVSSTVPIYDTQPESVQRRLGPGLEAMTGPLVEPAGLDGDRGNIASIRREIEVP